MLVSHLFEAPIEDMTLVGDWDRNSSFRRPADRKLLTNPKAQAKIKQKWEKVVVPFNIYLVNRGDVMRYQQRGEVTEAWLAKNMPKLLPEMTIRDDAVNVIYTSNSGADWKPMTSWIMAHRFGHAIYNVPEYQDIRKRIHGTLTRLLVSVYQQTLPAWSDFGRKAAFDKMLTKFSAQIGTFKSARDGQVRNEFEFVYELLAQYMMTGKVTFRPIPTVFGHGRQNWGRPDQYAYVKQGTDTTNIDEELEDFAEEITYHFENLMHYCVGRIFVM